MSKILFLANHFITLYNFRKELIKRIVDEGHEVYLSIPASDQNEFFRELGCEIIETPIDRRGVNPVKDIKLILSYHLLIKQLKPDIIFSYTIKPNIYGSMISNILKIKQVSNVTGTGATFINNNLISKVAKAFYKISIKHSYKVFFQNKGDCEFFIKNKMIKSNYDILPGSGVNLEHFKYSNLPHDNETNFIFIGRIMKLKGIDEYLKAAQVIKSEFPNTNFFVAGFIEEEKYKKIIDDYNNNGIINYIGFQKDIKSWIEKCHCTILPSYGGEGVPNVLLESAAMGRICIASNIDGSKEVIDNYTTGYLFEKGNEQDLINKIKLFLNQSSDNKRAMGIRSREKMIKEFNREFIIDKYLKEIKLLEVEKNDGKKKGTFTKV
ncbi:capsular polysaccharide biosynthesis protein [Lysinibacillus sp. PLM2]|nr:capsular polysaccharide biosynthesis protein [Lysinibacillus sp. PLM2]